MEKLLAEKREHERHLRVLHAIDDSDIEHTLPPIPHYTGKKEMTFTETVKEALGREFINFCRP